MKKKNFVVIFMLSMSFGCFGFTLHAKEPEVWPISKPNISECLKLAKKHHYKENGIDIVGVYDGKYTDFWGTTIVTLKEPGTKAIAKVYMPDRWGSCQVFEGNRDYLPQKPWKKGDIIDIGEYKDSHDDIGVNGNTLTLDISHGKGDGHWMMGYFDGPPRPSYRYYIDQTQWHTCQQHIKKDYDSDIEYVRQLTGVKDYHDLPYINLNNFMRYRGNNATLTTDYKTGQKYVFVGFSTYVCPESNGKSIVQLVNESTYIDDVNMHMGRAEGIIKDGDIIAYVEIPTSEAAAIGLPGFHKFIATLKGVDFNGSSPTISGSGKISYSYFVASDGHFI